MRIGIDARKIADFGIGTYIRGLLGALCEIGEDEMVVFATAGAAIPDKCIHVTVDAPHYSIRELFTIGRAADRAHLDLFHSPHYVLPFMRTPAVVTIHDLIHLSQPPRSPLAPFYARAMLGRAVRASRRVLTVSEASKRAIVETLLAEPDHVVVTPDGVDARFFEEGPAATGHYFLFVGNDKPHKNAGLLVEALSRVRREEPRIQLVLCGGDFARFASREGVVSAGFVSDGELEALYRGAIALVMPSAEEGFGLPAAEAMACGTAVITSNAPALVEVTGDAAMHVDAEPDALAAAMLRVCRDDALRSAMAVLGREMARAMTWKRCAELTRAAYREAV